MLHKFHCAVPYRCVSESPPMIYLRTKRNVSKRTAFCNYQIRSASTSNDFLGNRVFSHSANKNGNDVNLAMTLDLPHQIYWALSHFLSIFPLKLVASKIKTMIIQVSCFHVQNDNRYISFHCPIWDNWSIRVQFEPLILDIETGVYR